MGLIKEARMTTRLALEARVFIPSEQDLEMSPCEHAFTAESKAFIEGEDHVAEISWHLRCLRPESQNDWRWMAGVLGIAYQERAKTRRGFDQEKDEEASWTYKDWAQPRRGGINPVLADRIADLYPPSFCR